MEFAFKMGNKQYHRNGNEAMQPLKFKEHGGEFSGTCRLDSNLTKHSEHLKLRCGCEHSKQNEGITLLNTRQDMPGSLKSRVSVRGVLEWQPHFSLL